MKAIVLAGGKGTRLQSVVQDLPKPLAPVRGEPFLYILFRFLDFYSIRDITVSIQHLAEAFEARLPEMQKISSGISLVREPSPLGTGGAVRFACEGLDPAEHILVMNGDTFFDFDLGAFVQRHRADSALALKSVPDSSRYGTVEVDGGKVTRYLEKVPGAQAGLIYSGFCILRVKDILLLLPEGPSSLEKDFFPRILSEPDGLKADVFGGRFIDIGVPEDYNFANSQFDFSRFSRLLETPKR